MKEEARERNERIIKKSARFAGLWANPDFQDWRDGVVGKKLKDLKDNIANHNITTTEGEQEALGMIRSYQALKQGTDDIFKFWNLAGKVARKKLKE